MSDDEASNVVQYIIVRADLKSTLNWPLGKIISDCCYASIYVNRTNALDDVTKTYLEDLEEMQKIVIEIENEDALVRLAEELSEKKVIHKVWMNKAENTRTCIAIKPMVREEVEKFVLPSKEGNKEENKKENKEEPK